MTTTIDSKPAYKPKLSRKFEPLVLVLLAAASAVAVLTTIGIVLSVVYESLRFFAEVPVLSFLFGTEWAPTAEPGQFGILPLLGGTLLITLIAIVIAGPLGLFSAIYLAEYASANARRWIKPVLELLAGIPTVVLGFFAALTVAPLLRQMGESIGLTVASESALAAGLVMGMMIVPLIGWHVAGPMGLLVTSIAKFGPSSVLTIFALKFWNNFKDHPFRSRFEKALKPITVGLVLVSAWIIAESSAYNLLLVIIVVITAGLGFFKNIHPIWLMLIGAGLGVAFL
jgi:hypothetical protein